MKKMWTIRFPLVLVTSLLATSSLAAPKDKPTVAVFPFTVGKRVTVAQADKAAKELVFALKTQRSDVAGPELFHSYMNTFKRKMAAKKGGGWARALAQREGVPYVIAGHLAPGKKNKKKNKLTLMLIDTGSGKLVKGARVTEGGVGWAHKMATLFLSKLPPPASPVAVVAPDPAIPTPATPTPAASQPQPELTPSTNVTSAPMTPDTTAQETAEVAELPPWHDNIAGISAAGVAVGFVFAGALAGGLSLLDTSELGNTTQSNVTRRQELINGAYAKGIVADVCYGVAVLAGAASAVLFITGVGQEPVAAEAGAGSGEEGDGASKATSLPAQ